MNVRQILFQDLPVLQDIYDVAKSEHVGALGRIGIVACQHLLESTGSLVESLCRNGADASNVFVLGKVYSTNKSVSERLKSLGCQISDGSPAGSPGEHAAAARRDATSLWSLALSHFRENGVEQLILLDDGGGIHSEMPMTVREMFKVVAVEQTTFGMARNTLIGARGAPVINVASSAAKRHFETPLICRAILDRAQTVISEFEQKPKCGVIGLGKIGLYLADSLREAGFSISGFDSNPQRVEMLSRTEQCETAAEVIERASIVFGCVGEDTLRMNDLEAANGELRVLASCSSSDVEFRSVLRGAIPWAAVGNPNEVCPTLVSDYASRSKNLRVLRSGYPVNFDNSPESVPSNDIQLTRSLLLAAILQACSILEDGVPLIRGSVMLDPKMQQMAVQSWGRHTGREVGDAFDLEWFINESQGSR